MFFLTRKNLVAFSSKQSKWDIFLKLLLKAAQEWGHSTCHPEVRLSVCNDIMLSSLAPQFTSSYSTLTIQNFNNNFCLEEEKKKKKRFDVSVWAEMLKTKLQVKHFNNLLFIILLFYGVNAFVVLLNLHKAYRATLNEKKIS